MHVINKTNNRNCRKRVHMYNVMCFRINSYYDKQLRMLMTIMYVADGLRASLVNVEVCVETFQQISMEEM